MRNPDKDKSKRLSRRNFIATGSMAGAGVLMPGRDDLLPMPGKGWLHDTPEPA